MTMNQLVTRWQDLCVGVLVGAVVAMIAPAAAGADVSFDVAITRAEVGRTRVVAFHAPAAEADRELEASVADGRLLEVVDKPAVLAGYTNGFVRVRGVKAGMTTLVVGGAKVKVEVVAPRVADQGPLAQILEPASGAVVFGRFTVGVEVDQSG